MYVQTQDNKKPVTNELAAKHVTVYRNTDWFSSSHVDQPTGFPN